MAGDLCRVFLGWRLREDRDALLALEEGALRIDLLTGECWCDGDPLPPLFIAGELRGELQKVAVREGAITRAFLDAEFSKRQAWLRGEERPALDLACRVRLRSANGGQGAAEANNSAMR